MVGGTLGLMFGSIMAYNKVNNVDKDKIRSLLQDISKDMEKKRNERKHYYLLCTSTTLYFIDIGRSCM